MRVSDLDLESISSRLVLTVGNFEANKEDVSSYPYVVKGDIVILCDLCIGEKNNDGLYTSCLTVTNELMEKWNISKDTLFSMAVTNGRAIMKPYIQQISSEKDEEFGLNFNYVLTNSYHFNGASSIFYDFSLLERIGQEVLLVPASSNEIYVISPVPENNREKFINNVDEIYQQYREKTGAGLTSHVLLYDRTEKAILKDTEGNFFNLDLKNSMEDEMIIDRSASHSLGK